MEHRLVAATLSLAHRRAQLPPATLAVSLPQSVESSLNTIGEALPFVGCSWDLG
jgi:hypothetical protein